jgi:hypothetical protein
MIQIWIGIKLESLDPDHTHHRSATPPSCRYGLQLAFFLLLGYAEQPQDGQGPHQAGEPAEGEAKQPERLRRGGCPHQVCKMFFLKIFEKCAPFYLQLEVARFISNRHEKL